MLFDFGELSDVISSQGSGWYVGGLFYVPYAYPSDKTNYIIGTFYESYDEE